MQAAQWPAALLDTDALLLWIDLEVGAGSCYDRPMIERIVFRHRRFNRKIPVLKATIFADGEPGAGLRAWLAEHTPTAFIEKRCRRVSPQWMFFWRRFEGQVAVLFTNPADAAAFDQAVRVTPALKNCLAA